jgi:curved DNA-binding protein CbpA
MSPQAAEIENLAHAYRVLDVTWNASPRAIKSSYRKRVKRWHPDRYPPGTESHAESTLMTRLLNDAFARIENAPLRNGTATPFSRPAGARPHAAPNTANADASPNEPDPSGSSRNEYIPHDPPPSLTASWNVPAQPAPATTPSARSIGSASSFASCWARSSGPS